jgi:epoxyqueuosine reductase QueG
LSLITGKKRSLSPLSGQIVKWIAARVRQADNGVAYRTPLVGFARASDPRFDDLPVRIPGHLHPRDLLPGAQSVCAFFLPFAKALVRENKEGRAASASWAHAYVETNALLADISQAVVTSLAQMGVLAAWEPPTHNFDPVRLVSAWSHKSVGAIAGLGAFGHHHMLITSSGCAGRLGSVVIGAEIPPTRPTQQPFCTFDQGCRDCIRRCPPNALSEQGLDRARCYEQCLINDARFSQWVADVCGKCATGPCAVKPGGVGPSLTA